MPVIEEHLRLDKLLFDRGKARVKNRDEFVLGSLFPDRYDLTYSVSLKRFTNFEDERVDKIIDDTHIPLFNKDLRYPNFMEFYRRYYHELAYSDFLKGCLYHLICDTSFNMEWAKYSYRIDENTYRVVVDDWGKEYYSITDLLKDKYNQTMDNVIRTSNMDELFSMVSQVDKSEIDVGMLTYYIDSIDMLVYKVNRYYEDVVKHCTTTDTFIVPLSFYETTAKDSISTYEKISILSDW